MKMSWNNTEKGGSADYQCGYCFNLVASNEGYSSSSYSVIAICPHCAQPTYLTETNQVPGIAPGSLIENAPDLATKLYEEARKAISAGAYTASVLVCRKLLMNIAVAEGAEEGKRFIQYVEFLADKGYIPPNGKAWVDHIRKKGNEATHDIALMTKDDATELVLFSEVLMKFVYEFPAKVSSNKT